MRLRRRDTARDTGPSSTLHDEASIEESGQSSHEVDVDVDLSSTSTSTSNAAERDNGLTGDAPRTRATRARARRGAEGAAPVEDDKEPESIPRLRRTRTTAARDEDKGKRIVRFDTSSSSSYSDGGNMSSESSEYVDESEVTTRGKARTHAPRKSTVANGLLSSSEDEEVDDEDIDLVASSDEDINVALGSGARRRKRTTARQDTHANGNIVLDDDYDKDVYDSDMNEVANETAEANSHLDYDVTQLFPVSGDNFDLPVKEDGDMRPLWVSKNGRIIMEAFGPLCEQAKEFLLVVAEPVSRLSHFHEYKITEFSLYAAISVGLNSENIIKTLGILSKTPIPDKLREFVSANCLTYGKVKIILKNNTLWIETEKEILEKFVCDEKIEQYILGEPTPVDNQYVDNIRDGGEAFEQTDLAMTENDSSGQTNQVSTKPRPAPSGADVNNDIMYIEDELTVDTTADDEFYDDDEEEFHINLNDLVQLEETMQAHENVAGSGPSSSATSGVGDKLANNTEDAQPIILDDNNNDTSKQKDTRPDSPIETLSSLRKKRRLEEEERLLQEKEKEQLDKQRRLEADVERELIVLRDLEGSTAAIANANQRKQQQSADGNNQDTYLEDITKTTGEIDSNLHTVMIQSDSAELIKKRSTELQYPVMEEYDFKDDRTNPTLDITLKSAVKLRAYQAKSLSKMFGGSRARSGIIVLPCGAGKTLVGVAAACTAKKSCLVLCTSSVSVEQWAREFKYWSTIQDYQIAKFTSQEKTVFQSESGVLISTYTMLAFNGKRAYDTQKVIDFIMSREWGYLILDEVHVVPADMFKKVLSMVAAHSKLGLTATLVREDNKIDTLNYLIGPKLYEANWLELASEGHISEVQCFEIWCPMTVEFYQEYLNASMRKRQLLYTMNPRKIQACQYLIKYHEQRGDKIIVFSDNVFALKHYANKLGKPYLYGGTNPSERLRILQQFRYNTSWSTLFLSKVGDTSIDIPEASCLIQISSHFGSRRQEAQRLGRVLRSKKSGQNVAFFYSLISRDTIEAYYAEKRQRFLVDQGYSYSIITQLKSGLLKMSEVVYSNKNEQLELLNTILITNDMEFDDQDIERRRKARKEKAAKRKKTKTVTQGDESATIQIDTEDAPGPENGENGENDDYCSTDLSASSSDEELAPTIRRGGTLQSLAGGDTMAYMERRVLSTKETPWNRLTYN